MFNAVKEYFDERMRELAERRVKGDENVVGCLMGYVSQNPELSDWLLDRYEHYCEKAGLFSSETGAPM